MKCPKCHYLGLDTGTRCRHCGYEFSLADLTTSQDPAAPVEPVVRGGNPGRRTPASPRVRHDRPPPTPGAGLEQPLSRIPDSGPLDLPLFPDADFESPHLPPPRPPLAVRKATPTPARLRHRSAHPEGDAYELGLEPAAEPAPLEPEAVAEEAQGNGEHVRAGASGAVPAPALRRLAAAGTDVALVAAIDATVLYFTLRMCELSVSQLTALPPLPMAAFFAILNGGYLVLFTGVFGQTLGKMLVGIEVVTADLATLDLGRSLYRAIVILSSVLTAGLGFLPALVGDGRALHDRLAGTRVVMAKPAHLSA